MKAVPALAIALRVLVAEAAAAAFVPPLNNNDADLNLDGSNVQSVSSTINTALMTRLQELTKDTSKLEPIKKQYLMEPSLAQDDLSLERLARETLITTRLKIPLNRTRIDESTIEGAGRGLFAMEDISKGEIITCYPGDALLCEYREDKNLGNIDGEDEEHFDEEWELVNEEPVIWGEHVNIEERMDEDAVFDGIEELAAPPLTSYSVNLDGICSVMGLPTLDKDPAYYGHFANDGGHLPPQNNGHDIKDEERNISAYALKSDHLSNAIHELLGRGYALGGLHIVTVATKDIKEGEEIFVTYGHDYWLVA